MRKHRRPTSLLLNLLRETPRMSHDSRGASLYYWFKEKITSIVVSTSTGSPLRVVGRYFH